MTNIAEARCATPGNQQEPTAASSTTKCPTDCDCSTPGQLVDPNLKQGTELIQLVAPGTELTPRLTQLDVTFRRLFRFRETASTGENNCVVSS